jgi:hypothetical protein
MKTEKRVSTTQGREKSSHPVPVEKVSKGQPCCGRTYNEESDFSQINFAVYQSILDQRNELLGSVKAHHLP